MSARGPFQDQPSIRVEALALSRGGRVLFEDLSFAAAPGAYVEIQGSNGSGKTSLLRTIAGYLKPSAGEVAIASVEEPALALHYLGHANGLKREASVRSHLRYWAGLLGGAFGDGSAAQSLGLSRLLDAPVRVLSEGQKRRLGLARLIIAPRAIWLLDEPAAALDDEGRTVLQGMIAAHRRGGGIVLAAVHEPLGAAPSHVVRIGT